MKASDYAPPGPYGSPPAGQYVPQQQRREAVLDALRGAPLGDHDMQVTHWVVSWDDSTVRTIVSWLERVRVAGAAEAGGAS